MSKKMAGVPQPMVPLFPQQTYMTNTSNSTSRVSSQYNSPKELLQLAASGLRNPGQVHSCGDLQFKISYRDPLYIYRSLLLRGWGHPKITMC